MTENPKPSAADVAAVEWYLEREYGVAPGVDPVDGKRYYELEDLLRQIRAAKG